MSASLAAAMADAISAGRPDGVALMRILAEAATQSAARDAFAAAAADCQDRDDTAAAAILARLQRLWADNPGAWSLVRRTLATARHDSAPADPEAAVSAWAAVFDRLAADTPEAGVALYALGNPSLLAAATGEVVTVMERLGLLDPAYDGLDLGCGIGRFLMALAPRLRSVVGLDIAPAMVAEARRRCAGFATAQVAVSRGPDLPGLAPESLDLVLAADVFPYLVQAGGDIAARHITAFGRVLRPGGTALILNYAYGQDPAADAAAIEGLAAGTGLRLERVATGDFQSWDAASFLLRRKRGLS